MGKLIEEAGDGVHYFGTDIPLEVIFTSPNPGNQPTLPIISWASTRFGAFSKHLYLTMGDKKIRIYHMAAVQLSSNPSPSAECDAVCSKWWNLTKSALIDQPQYTHMNLVGEFMRENVEVGLPFPHQCPGLATLAFIKGARAV